MLHTFFDDETLVRCVRTVKEAAEQAGRDPDSVWVWSCFATIGDHLPEPVRLKKTVGRLATYLQAYGDLMVSTNGWDPEPLARFRADPFVAGFRGALDQVATTEELEHVATLIPPAWLASAATGYARAVRGGGGAPVRPRRRRRHPPRRLPRRPPPRRRRLGRLIRVTEYGGETPRPVLGCVSTRISDVGGEVDQLAEGVEPLGRRTGELGLDRS